MIRKKTLSVIIIVLILILTGVGVAYFYLAPRNTTGGEESVTKKLSDYFPFGRQTQDVNTAPTEENSDRTIETPAGGVPKLRHITTSPIAGAISFDKIVEENVGESKVKTLKSFIRFVDRGTGHVYETATSTVLVKKISNTTIPKIYSALWANESNVLLRYLTDDETTQNYDATLVARNTASTTPDETPYTLQGTFLAASIEAITTSPTKSNYFYISNETGGAKGIVSNISGNLKSTIFESPFGEWLVSWPKENTVTLTTKPSSNVSGFMYTLNPQNGTFQKILSGINGLTTLTDPTATEFLYSEGQIDDPLRLNVFTIQPGTHYTLRIKTLPEKCVWSTLELGMAYCAVPASIPAGKYPNAWYKGLVSFNDTIVKIDTHTNEATILLEAQSAANAIDGINLFLSKREDTLFFTNKKDNSLWSLNLLTR